MPKIVALRMRPECALFEGTGFVTVGAQASTLSGSVVDEVTPIALGPIAGYQIKRGGKLYFVEASNVVQADLEPDASPPPLDRLAAKKG